MIDMKKFIEMIKDFKLSIKKGLEDVKRYRKAIKEVCEEEWMKLYESELYRENTDMKEQLKHDIHIYRMTHFKFALSKYLPHNLIPYSLWNYSNYGMLYIAPEGDKSLAAKIIKNMYIKYSSREFNKISSFNSLLLNTNKDLDIPRDNLIVLIVDFKAMSKIKKFNIIEEYAKMYNQFNVSYDTRIEIEELLEMRNFTIKGKFVADRIYKHTIVERTLADIKHNYPRDDFDILVGNDIYRKSKVEVYDILP